MSQMESNQGKLLDVISQIDDKRIILNGYARLKETMEDLMLMEDDQIIIKAYKALKDSADDLIQVGRKIDSAREYCNAESLSINNGSYEGKVEQCSEYLVESANKISCFADLLISVVDREKIMEYLSDSPAEKSGAFAALLSSSPTSSLQQPLDPIQPSAPTTPSAPTQPSPPTAPSAPTQPSAPSAPTQPSAPSAPTQPKAPSAPTQPSAPSGPGGGSQSDFGDRGQPQQPSAPSGPGGGSQSDFGGRGQPQQPSPPNGPGNQNFPPEGPNGERPPSPPGRFT